MFHGVNLNLNPALTEDVIKPILVVIITFEWCKFM